MKIDLNNPTKALEYKKSGNLEFYYNTELEPNLENFRNLETIKFDLINETLIDKINNKLKKATTNELIIYVNYQYSILLLYFN
mgnify:CR=1 FL=1